MGELMTKKPPISEVDFINTSKNHRELSSKLRKLDIDSSNIEEYAKYICSKWYSLGLEHLSEAKKILPLGCDRSVYSRSYYAAYNASKATRYYNSGSVSLRGDDHTRASVDLPDDLTDVSSWVQVVSTLYEHRLRADYDNWENSKQNSMTPVQAVEAADQFIEVCRLYLQEKFGVEL